jgi:hypothetical protein
VAYSTEKALDVFEIEFLGRRLFDDRLACFTAFYIHLMETVAIHSPFLSQVGHDLQDIMT